jgi:hypothetical protein
MTLQNSLPRLFEAITLAIREAVEEGVDDAYRSSQLAAAAELLDNIAPRVVWSDEALLAPARRARDVLDAAVAASEPGELPLSRAALADELPPAAAEERFAARERHLAALGEVADWVVVGGPPDVRAALDEFLRWQLEQERLLVRAGAEGKVSRTVRPEDASEPAEPR